MSWKLNAALSPLVGRGQEWGWLRCAAGATRVRDGTRVVDLATAAPREILCLRRTTLAYVSQFLRMIPRVGVRAVVEAA